MNDSIHRGVIARAEGASKVYTAGDTTITALHPTHLDVRTGELLLILGPSGSGKTTLLSLLGCVIYPSSGKILINGTDTSTLNAKQMAALRLHTIGFVFQNFNLIAPLTAEQNVMLPLRLQGVHDKEARERAHNVLLRVGMIHRAKSLPRMLSGGEQQRIAIARALVTEPKLMLCDEPTASLDAASVAIVMEELRGIANSGRAIAVVTHDMRLRPYADRIIEVENGIARESDVQCSSSHHH
ncbi:MAG: ABC transporter ATP-binding protein [Bacteroidota bacterium]|nr:ABC transporter ATP-binding protein [Candidatus Kapabacteria bacterium]MDW8221102.1 ABC transporter ATP-binding protein [Bacteroidota bacterium]